MAAWARVKCSHLLSDSMSDRLGAVVGCIGDQSCELISPQSGKNIGLAEAVLENVAGVHNGVVSLLMAKCVVDSLQPVKVDECQREWLSCSASQLQVMSFTR